MDKTKKKMLKWYVPNQKNVTETAKERLQEQARNSYRYFSGGEETKNKENMVEWKILI